MWYDNGQFSGVLCLVPLAYFVDFLSILETSFVHPNAKTKSNKILAFIHSSPPFSFSFFLKKERKKSTCGGYSWHRVVAKLTLQSANSFSNGCYLKKAHHAFLNGVCNFIKNLMNRRNLKYILYMYFFSCKRHLMHFHKANMIFK